MVSDVICNAGPCDRPFEEQHATTSIAVVLSGTFQYRSSVGHELMAPGSLLLANAGDSFCCGHEHGTGDRCVAFSYKSEMFERIAHDAGAPGMRFKIPRLPSIRPLAPLIVKAAVLQTRGSGPDCEELGVQLAAQAIQVAHSVGPRRTGTEPSALARVTRVVRMIDHDPDVPQTLQTLARIARLSPYHFLRTFEGIAGTTPHQYLLCMRLRRAAFRLWDESTKILDIALSCGFGDISNFNRAFRAEFGVSPRIYRARR